MRKKVAHEVLTGVVEAFKALPGVVDPHSETIYPAARVDLRPNNYIEFKTVSGTLRYSVAIVNHVTINTLDAVLEKAFSKQQWAVPERRLLATTYLTEGLIDRLLKEKIQFADVAGNMYLQNEHLYILVRGKPRLHKFAVDAFTTVGLKIIYILLLFPNLKDFTYRNISQAADVGLGSVSRTMGSLIQQGYLDKVSSDTVRVADYQRLLERWELGYLEAVRPRLGPTAWYILPGKHEGLLKFVAGRDDVLVGGEKAAALFTGTPESDTQTLTLHAHPMSHPRLRSDFGLISLRPAAGLTIMESQEALESPFPILYLLKSMTPYDHYEPKQVDTDFTLANPLLVRTDLLAQGGQSPREIATKLLEDVILPNAERAQR